MKDLTPVFIVSDTFDEFVNISFDWKGMKTLGIIFSARIEDKVFNADDISVRYYISSAESTAEEFSHAARENWAIENKLHWKMDVAMREDDCRIRRGNAAEMLTGFRHMAVNMLNNTKTFKVGLKHKQKKAAMSTQYLSEDHAGCEVS
ncbi:ISAs1 family transposase [Endozoicomonas sp. 2B-B]